MSRLLLVRHGQASLFSDDYDRLSDDGKTQLTLLAKAWRDDGFVPDTVWTGTLRRQQASADAVAAVFAAAGLAWPAPAIDAGLNEYPAEELMPLLLDEFAGEFPALADMASAFESAADERARYRHFHRLLEALMTHWVAGGGRAALPVTWTDFSAGVRAALERVRQATGSGRTAVVFTSGGPIGISVQTALDAPDLKAMELNWRIHNASVTAYTFSGRRLSLDSFNDTRHLPRPLLTYR